MDAEIVERTPGPIRIIDSAHAKYEKYLPDHLLPLYEESVADDQLLHLRREIALMDVRIKSLVSKLDANAMLPTDIMNDLQAEFGDDIPPGLLPKLAEYIYTLLPEGYVDRQTFKRLDQLATKYENAIAGREVRKADSSLRLLLRVLHEGRRAGDIWDELQDALNHRRMLTQAEQKYLVEISQLISVEKAVIVLAATIDALREAVFKYVDDSEIRRHLLADAERRYAAIFGTREDAGKNDPEMD